MLTVADLEELAAAFPPVPKDIVASTTGLERLRRVLPFAPAGMLATPLTLPVTIDDARLGEGIIAIRYTDDSTRFVLLTD